jgi:chloramphenicol 3-O-phosphotransferase
MADIVVWVVGVPVALYVLLMITVKVVGVGRPYEELDRRRQRRM